MGDMLRRFSRTMRHCWQLVMAKKGGRIYILTPLKQTYDHKTLTLVIYQCAVPKDLSTTLYRAGSPAN
jgi:hypothetical protein